MELLWGILCIAPGIFLGLGDLFSGYKLVSGFGAMVFIPVLIYGVLMAVAGILVLTVWPVGRVFSVLLLAVQLLICLYAVVQGFIKFSIGAADTRMWFAIAFYLFFGLIAAAGIGFFLAPRDRIWQD